MKRIDEARKVIHTETQRSVSEFDFQNKVVILENRDVEALGRYVGPNFSNHREKLHCYWLDEKLISLGYRDQQIAQIYQEYHPRVPWPDEIVLFRREFLVAAPVLAMISHATHERGHQFAITIVCETLGRDAWIDVVQTDVIPFVESISLHYAAETDAAYQPAFAPNRLDSSTIKQIKRDFTIPDVLQRWIFGEVSSGIF